MRLIARWNARHSRNAGQIIVLFALYLLVLIVIIGLAVDLGFAYVTRGELSKAVDAAALEGLNNINLGTVTATSVVGYIRCQLRASGHAGPRPHRDQPEHCLQHRLQYQHDDNRQRPDADQNVFRRASARLEHAHSRHQQPGHPREAHRGTGSGQIRFDGHGWWGSCDARSGVGFPGRVR
jgi:hypothetical protein